MFLYRSPSNVLGGHLDLTVSSYSTTNGGLSNSISYALREDTARIMQNERIQVINLGLNQVAEDMEQQAAEAIHLDWLQSSGDDQVLIDLLDSLLYPVLR